jgi:outer membrane biosynthesis protein TonB
VNADILRYGSVILVALLLVAAVWGFVFRGDNLPPPRRVQDVTVVTLIPPPPPPPPPVTPPPQEEKMIEQPKMIEQERQLEKPAEKPREDDSAKNDLPPTSPGLDGPATVPTSAFGAGGPGRGGDGERGSKWGWYASIVQMQIEQALRANERTRNAVLQIQMRIWADSSGRVTRVQLLSSSGNPEMDALIRDVVMPSITLREPPPKDMPMPILTRVTERRPG